MARHNENIGSAQDFHNVLPKPRECDVSLVLLHKRVSFLVPSDYLEFELRILRLERCERRKKIIDTLDGLQSTNIGNNDLINFQLSAFRFPLRTIYSRRNHSSLLCDEEFFKQ